MDVDLYFKDVFIVQLLRIPVYFMKIILCSFLFRIGLLNH